MIEICVIVCFKASECPVDHIITIYNSAQVHSSSHLPSSTKLLPQLLPQSLLYTDIHAELHVLTTHHYLIPHSTLNIP